MLKLLLQVMGGDPLLWIVGTVVPIMFYCLACYYTDSKFQLAIAKVTNLPLYSLPYHLFP